MLATHLLIHILPSIGPRIDASVVSVITATTATAADAATISATSADTGWIVERRRLRRRVAAGQGVAAAGQGVAAAGLLMAAAVVVVVMRRHDRRHLLLLSSFLLVGERGLVVHSQGEPTQGRTEPPATSVSEGRL